MFKANIDSHSVVSNKPELFNCQFSFQDFPVIHSTTPDIVLGTLPLNVARHQSHVKVPISSPVTEHSLVNHLLAEKQI
ncbi:hypothetical protein DPMN_149376 [Dreissena polymorpha]|uniref:Uncharacterized protein n=1 Tax=Dreissena polymorpha TaxID=45954 RepID=A0A9D4J2D8_DREPO|nr:hypothetical protein DPMN_149376 [Dreissena polymorpha]